MIATLIAEMTPQDAQILAEYGAGEKQQAIATKLGCTIEAVAEVVKDFAEGERGKATTLSLAWQRTPKAAEWRKQARMAPKVTAPAPEVKPAAKGYVVTGEATRTQNSTTATVVDPKPEITVDLTPPAEPEPALVERHDPEPIEVPVTLADGTQPPDATWAWDGAVEVPVKEVRREPGKVTVVLDNRDGQLVQPPAEQIPPPVLAIAIGEAEATGDPKLAKAAAHAREVLAALRADVDDHKRTAKLREELAQIEARAAEIRAQLSLPRARPTPAENTAMRKWARLNGWEVSDRGNLPAVVVDAYHKAMAS